MKNKVFTAAVVLGLAFTAYLVISPVLAQTYWGVEAVAEDIPPIDGEGTEDDAAFSCGEDGEAYDGDPGSMPHMDSYEEGASCGDSEDGGMMSGDHGDMMGGSGGMMGSYSPSSRRSGMGSPS